MSTHVDPYRLLCELSLSIDLNANDFFANACADSVELDSLDLSWVVPIIEKYGFGGYNAVMAYIRQQMPLMSYQTDSFASAYAELKERCPHVNSEL